MKIGQYPVTNITKKSATVGCTNVTIDDVRGLLKEMESAKSFVTEGYNESMPSSNRFANFTLTPENSGSISVDGGARWDTKDVRFCLFRKDAKELYDFLGDYFKKFPEKA